MPILTLPDHRQLPRLDEPGTIVGLTLLVAVQCRCGDPTSIGLVNAQPAVCESCGTVFSLDAVTWARGVPTPKIALRSSPSRAQTLSS